MNDNLIYDLYSYAFKHDLPLIVDAADEIKRLRRELGQVSDADSWVSKADAAHLDSLLNWCEFNDMESHRALQRLVNDRARLRGEVTRLRKETRHETR